MFLFKLIDSFLAFWGEVLISIYQKTISPDHSLLGKAFPFWGCKFYPSCSQYAKEYLSEYGFFRSIIPIVKRIGRCSPNAECDIDKVPEKSH